MFIVENSLSEEQVEVLKDAGKENTLNAIQAISNGLKLELKELSEGNPNYTKHSFNTCKEILLKEDGLMVIMAVSILVNPELITLAAKHEDADEIQVTKDLIEAHEKAYKRLSDLDLSGL